jgi:hypothetical protein
MAAHLRKLADDVDDFLAASRRANAKSKDNEPSP